MHLREVDANLLVTLDALLVDASVTRAAERLGRSASAISHALAKLREIFADELFVRAGQRLVPTAKALELAPTVHVILAGMEAPPNFGRDYTAGFHDVFPELARKYKVAFVPFLLEGVAGIEAMNQRDGIHPTAAGARKVADNLWAALEPLVEGRADRQ